MKIKTLSFILFFCYLSIANGGYDEVRRLRPLSPTARARKAKNTLFNQQLSVAMARKKQQPYIGKQDGMKQTDKIVKLPGQPDNLKLQQYSGYITINPNSGKALFYYFVESFVDAAEKPLVLWLNGGPGCSSFGYGAMTELGPFYVNNDRKTLRSNDYAWNNVANMLFLESPAGVGFSYSNSSTDYQMTGDKSTTEDAYIFLLNWLERFPEYKGRDFYITGESYAGRYIPELANYIVSKKVNNSHTINIKGVAIGNPYFDDDINEKGKYDFLLSRDLISREGYGMVQKNCRFRGPESERCDMFKQFYLPYRNTIDSYNIYAPVCPDIKDVSLPYDEMTKNDPCVANYTTTYLNRPEVQAALHANTTRIGYQWSICSDFFNEENWHDTPPNMIPVVQELLSNGLRIWIYSGDIDSSCPITSTKYFLEKLGLNQMESTRAWFSGKELAGLVTKYDSMTFLSVRGAGHMVPRDQPHRALILFSSFLQDNLPMKNPDE